MRTGTSGQNGKTLSIYLTDPEADEPTTAPRSEVWIQPSIYRPHWIEYLDALQEDVDFCEDGETTIVRDGVIAILGVFITLSTMVREKLKRMKCHRYCCRLDQLSDILGTGLSERNSTQQRSPEVSSAQTRRGAGGREQRPYMKRSSIQQLKLRPRCARCRKLGHWARECPGGNGGQRIDERYDKRAWKPEEAQKGLSRCSGSHETETFLSWSIMDICRSSPWKSPGGHGCPGGLRREPATSQIARGTQSPGRVESGETRIRKRHRRCDTTKYCICARRIGRVQRYHPIHCRGAGRSTTTAGVNNEDTPSYPGLG